MQVDVFKGHNVRTEVQNGNLIFALADVCAVLGDANPSNVVKRIRESSLHIVEVDTGYGIKPMNFVDERGLIRVLQTSRSPLVESFQDWADERVEQLLQGKTVNAAGVTTESEDALVMRAIGILQTRLDEQAKELETARPKAATYDRVLTPEHTFGFRQMCSHLREYFPVNEEDVKRVLRERGLLHKLTLTATAKAIDGGWAVQRASGIWGGKERFQPRFTTKTLEWLLDELAPLQEVA
ncbi:phage antirepressor KilAC domain-containing protein [Rothia terrae]|uniref:phage antirepressor KilAC domain-containing protein n=1 Tax=Rothia terrae TaxID=396015 RepID=UPI00381BDF65